MKLNTLTGMRTRQNSVHYKSLQCLVMDYFTFTYSCRIANETHLLLFM